MKPHLSDIIQNNLQDITDLNKLPELYLNQFDIFAIRNGREKDPFTGLFIINIDEYGNILATYLPSEFKSRLVDTIVNLKQDLQKYFWSANPNAFYHSIEELKKDDYYGFWPFKKYIDYLIAKY
jgi:hypothetical protein